MSGRLFERLQREHDLWTRWEETRMAQETPDIWQADNALVQSAQRRHELALWAGWEETQAAQETPGVRWVDNIGHALIQSVTFTVGGEVLSDYHQEWLELWNMLGAFPLCQHCGGGRHYFSAMVSLCALTAPPSTRPRAVACIATVSSRCGRTERPPTCAAIPVLQRRQSSCVRPSQSYFLSPPSTLSPRPTQPCIRRCATHKAHCLI